jgi:pyruvate/2-oxoglutarate dehydrogenase complex dihydrolipoamide acyltransferase (E2) component
MNVPGGWLRKSTMWRKIALNTWAQPDDPTMYGVLEVDVGELNEWLKRRTEESGQKCTVTHAVARAVALVMKRQPEMNVLVRRGRIWLRRDADVFLQVAMPVEGNASADLSGTVVRQADTKDVPQIARELARQAEAVRAKKDGDMARTRSLLFALPGLVLRVLMTVLGWLTYGLNLRLPGTPTDPFGGVMVTSVGMFGIQMAFAPIVTFSRAPIVLVVNQVVERPVVRDGQIVIRPMLPITASIDHRIMDGFLAARIAADLRATLEDPRRLEG